MTTNDDSRVEAAARAIVKADDAIMRGIQRGDARDIARAALAAADAAAPARTLDRDALARALGDEMGCVRLYDDTANAYYCDTHGVGWLLSTNRCVRSERLAIRVLAVLADQPTVAETRAQALTDAADEISRLDDSDFLRGLVSIDGGATAMHEWAVETLRARAARERGTS